MYVIDAIGFIVSIGLIGLRYPHQVILACLINQLGQIITALLFHLPIAGILASGVFTQVQVDGTGQVAVLFFSLGGIFLNYAASTLATGYEYEPSSHLLHPFAALKYPFAVINFRFALIMLGVQIFRLIY